MPPAHIFALDHPCTFPIHFFALLSMVKHKVCKVQRFNLGFTSKSLSCLFVLLWNRSFCIKHPKIKNALALTLLDLQYHNHLRHFDDCLQKARQQICYQPCIHSKWYKNRQQTEKMQTSHIYVFVLEIGHVSLRQIFSVGTFRCIACCCMGMTSDLGQVYALYCHYHITMLLPAAARL